MEIAADALNFELMYLYHIIAFSVLLKNQIANKLNFIFLQISIYGIQEYSSLALNQF